jgi:DNA modification methylase
MENICIMDIQVHPKIGNPEIAEKSLNRMTYLMEVFGQFQPISIVEEGGRLYVVDGIIRLAAAKKLGWNSVSIKKVDWREDEILTNRLISNVASKRKHWQLAQEASAFINNLIGKSQGKKREISEIAHLLEETNEKKLKELAGDINKLTCEILGLPFKKNTLCNLLKVYEVHQNPTEELINLRLFELLDEGEISIHRAYELCINYQKATVERGKTALKDVIEYSKKSITDDPNHMVFTHTNEDLSFLEDGQVNTIICSPPYARGQANYTNAKRNLNTRVIHGEEATIEEYIKKEVEVYREVRNKLKDDGSLFIVIGESFKDGCDGVREHLVVAMIKDGWHYASNFNWVKAAQKPQSLKGRLQPAGEHILHFTKSSKFAFRELKKWTGGEFSLARTTGDGFKDGIKRPGHYLKWPIERFRTFIEEQNFVGFLKENGFNTGEVSEYGKPNHPCPFPLNLVLFLTLLTTEIGDTVADIWGGTGTVSYGAKLLHRKSISVDVDKVANQYAANRLSKCDHHVFTESELNEVEGYFTPIHEKDLSMAA